MALLAVAALLAFLFLPFFHGLKRKVAKPTGAKERACPEHKCLECTVGGVQTSKCEASCCNMSPQPIW